MRAETQVLLGAVDALLLPVRWRLSAFVTMVRSVNVVALIEKKSKLIRSAMQRGSLLGRPHVSR